MKPSDALRELFDDSGTVAFAERPEPLPGDLRFAWRMPVLALILERCRGGRSSIQALNVLWWAIRSDSSRRRMIAWLDGHQGPDQLLVRYDPSFTATLDLALGEGIVEISGKTVGLTPRGRVLALETMGAPALVAEKAFLARFSGKITQASIQSLLEWK